MLAAIVSSSDDAIVSKTLDGIITSWNPGAERIFGFTAAEAIGQPMLMLFPPDRVDEEQEILARIARGEPVQNFETVRVRKDGTHINVSVTTSQVINDAGKVIGASNITRDITERLALGEQLHRSQRLDSIGQLTGGIAHDFNNLLTVILGNAELLNEELAGNSTLQPLAEMIMTAAESGAALTQQLLAFARKQPLDPEAVDVNELVHHMEALLRRTLGGHIEIQFVHGDELWSALVDRTQLESALLNLCLNARDAMPAGGRLTIETRNAYLTQDYASQHDETEPGEYVLLAISDNGTGIAAEHLAHVFEPFFTTKPKGNGLGMPMIYGFIKQSRGHINVYSEVGQGTTVRLYLPRCSEVTMTEHKPTLSIPATGGAHSILLVDDNELVRRHAHAQLVALGYKVVEALDSPHALEILRSEQPIDLLFTDVIMPGMGGRQLADEAIKLRPDIKVLYTSGYTENGIIHHGRLDPGALLLTKPYRRGDLLHKVREALSRTSAT